MLILLQPGDIVNIEFDKTLQALKWTNNNNNADGEALSWLQPADIDVYWMKESVALGELSRMTAPPNPWVACIIVNSKNNQELGRGR